MALFHINSKTGKAGKCSATQGKCPFGGANDHFTSEEAARTAYEKTQEKNNVVALKKKKALDKVTPATREAFAANVKKYFPESTKLVVKPALWDPTGGYMGGSKFVGGKANEIDPETGRVKYRTMAEIASLVRNDIKEAKKAGEIPEWLNVSVTKTSGTVNVSLSVKVDGKARAIPKDWIQDYDYSPTPEAVAMTSYIKEIAQQYESSDTNSMVDYFNRSHYSYVNFREAWEDK